jgi:hypothetical protein
MKLNLDERLAKGVAITYTHENRGDCPAYIEKILAIPGVSSVFLVEDFMAIQRKPTAGWEDILSQARARGMRYSEFAAFENSWLESHAPQQILKARVVAQRVEARVIFEQNHKSFAVLVSLVQFGKRFISFAKRGVKYC